MKLSIIVTLPVSMKAGLTLLYFVPKSSGLVYSVNTARVLSRNAQPLACASMRMSLMSLIVSLNCVGVIRPSSSRGKVG